MDTHVHWLTTDRRREPLGIDNNRPEFGWRLGGVLGQTGYEIEVAPGATMGAQSPVWRSGVVERDQPFGARYAGEPLRSRSRYAWRVRVRLADGTWTAWSETAGFETGILDPGEWSADWITGPTAGKDDRRTLYFRHFVDLCAPVTRGRAYASALGWYRLWVNGTDHTGTALVPRWTPFDEYVEYQTYDVTGSFTEGPNVIGIVVADGRFRGHNGAFEKRAVYGNRLAAFVQIVLELADGSVATVATGDDWRVGRGRIRSADPMTGERADARIKETDWLVVDGVLEAETVARVLATERKLIAETVERVQEIDRLPGTVTRTRAGTQLVDFGQNFAGVGCVRLSGPPGQTVRLLYSEVLTRDGELNTGYLSPKHRRTKDYFQRDEVILGPGVTTYTPSFTIHGFRYLAVEGADPIGDDDVEGIVISSDLTPISEFHASDPWLERLWRNVRWSLTSNFTDTPTDCPTRERSGWTGDIQVFAPTAVQLVDACSYLRRYLRNLAAEQNDDGSVPPVIPAERSAVHPKHPLSFARFAVGWGDAAVLLPWTLYRYYNDITVLQEQYASAKRWIDQLDDRAANRRGLSRRLTRTDRAVERFILDTGYHWGEWVRAGERPLLAALRNFVVAPAATATAYLSHSSRVLAQMAEILGETADAAHYATLSENVRQAWRAAFVREGGALIGEDKQDEYVRALAFELLEPEERPRALGRLAELIEQAGDHLGTGFLSTPMLLPVLVDGGRPDLAYRLLMQASAPSWLYQVDNGATTVWEQWDGHDKNGNPRASHNHYAFGSVAQFLQERVAGLSPGGPGYRTIRFAPVVGGGLTSASIAVITPYGRAASSWRVDGDRFVLDVTVPPGATGVVLLGDKEIPVPAGVTSIEQPADGGLRT